MYAHRLFTLTAVSRASRLLLGVGLALLVGCASLKTLIPATTGPQPSSVGATALKPTPIVADGTALAARFPAIGVSYATPGLQGGRSGFTTNVELTRWLDELVSVNTGSTQFQVATMQIGMSQKGIPITAMILTRAARTDPGTVLASARPTVLLIGQQHGDEPAGAEALLAIARELAQGSLNPLLNHVNVIIVPRANPDGAAMGVRSLSNGADLDQDHLVLDSPEAQALAKLARDYRPAVVLDAQEYNPKGAFLAKFGATQGFDVLLQAANIANPAEFLDQAADEWFLQPLMNALKDERLSYDWNHSTSADPSDLTLSMDGLQPSSTRNAYGLKNSVSLLVKTRGIGLGKQHIQRRVHAHVSAIVSVLNSTALRAANLALLLPYTERDISSQACKNDVVLQAEPMTTPHPLTGLDLATGVDKVINAPWHSALTPKKLNTRARPCGYWLSASSEKVVERLRMHGVKVMKVKSRGTLETDFYRETERTSSGEKTNVTIKLVRGNVEAPLNSYYISLNQPLAHLVVAALEPDTQSSYFSNQLLSSLHNAARVVVEPTLKLQEF